MTRTIADLYRRAARRLAAPATPAARKPRRLSIETLEDRVTPVVGAFGIPNEVPVGGAYDAIGQYGVGESNNWETSGGGTGTLLSDFRHVISAQHVVGKNLDPNTGATTAFRLLDAQGQPTIIATPAKAHANEPGGQDVSILTLAELAPLTLKPFAIATGTNELNQLTTHVGYGRTGTGTTGKLLSANAVGAAKPSKTDVQELQRVRIVGTPTGGAYTLWVPGAPQVKVTLPYNATAGQVEAAIQFLPGMPDVRVAKVANSPINPYSGSFEVVFVTVDTAKYPDFNVPTLNVTSNLVGGAAVMDAVIDGGIPNRKRIGFNTVGKVTATRFQYDFDNGTAAADLFNDGLGLGAAESITASGDSGSPVFINGKVAGVHTSAQGNGLDGIPTNDDFGSSGSAVRLSAYKNFIDSVLDADYDLVLNMNNQPWGNDGIADDIRVNAAGGKVRILIDGVVRYEDDLGRVKSVRVQGSGDDEVISVEDLGVPVPVTVNAGGGGDTVRVVGVAAGTPFLADGGEGNDLIAVGAGFLDLAGHIKGDVSVYGGTGDDRLEFRDQNATDAGAKYTLEGPLFARTGMAAPVYYAGFDSVRVFTGQEAADVRVLSSPAPELRVTGGPGDDSFTVGGGDLDQVAPKVVIDGGAGQDTVTLKDEAEFKNATYELSGAKVSRGNFAATLSNVEALTLNASAADNTFLVRGTPALTTINAGLGGDLFHLAPDDRDLTALARGLILNGQGGGDLLVADDRSYAGSAPYTLTGGTLTRGGFPGVQFSGLETVRLLLSDAKNTVDIQGSKAGTEVRVEGNGGDDTFRITDTPHAKISIDGGSGFDRVVWSPRLLPPGARGSGYQYLDLHGIELIEFPFVG